MTPNPRYKNFRQKIFTAGDTEQFVSIVSRFRVNLTRTVCHTDGGDDDHNDHPVTFFRYGPDYFNTFGYLFEKMKKGVYVQIVSGELRIFLPFSNANYTNDYPPHAFDVDRTKYRDFNDMCSVLCRKEGRNFQPYRIHRYTNKWYCNNGLVRYEFPVQENESGVEVLLSMLDTLCKTRRVPDCEFFMNKRDFPVLKKDLSDPYDAMVGPGVEMKNHHGRWDPKGSFLPVISMCSTPSFADLLFPTWEDWMRASYQHDSSTFVFPDYRGNVRSYPDIEPEDWVLKTPKIVFRGASTGLGTTSMTNPRLFFARMALSHPEVMDVGITKWNLRPRKCRPQDPLDIITEDTEIPLKPFMSPVEQSRYRYILHLPGHSSAYRLSYELSMHSVIFMAPSVYRLWFSHLLIPYVHYIPIEGDLRVDSIGVDLLRKFEWCQQHPDDCIRIAENARRFYEDHLTFNAVLDYCHDQLSRIHEWMTRPENHIIYTSFDDERKAWYSKNTVFCPSPNEYLPNHSSSVVCHGKNTMIQRVGGDDGDRVVKIALAPGDDVYHEYFVGRVLNAILPVCPSTFIRVHEITAKDRFTMEYFPECITLEQYLGGSQSFDFQSFLQVAQQITLATRLAQRWVGFMHGDLCPWNILLVPNKFRGTLYFRFPNHDVQLTNHRFVAKMIDFDKSHVVYGTRSFTTATPFFRSSVQDMRCFWFHCAFMILTKHKLQKKEVSLIIAIIEFLSGRRFSRIVELKEFLMEAKKFSNLSKPMAPTITTGTSSLSSPQGMEFFRILFKLTTHESHSEVHKKPVDNTRLYSQIVKNISGVVVSSPTDHDDDDHEEYDLDEAAVLFKPPPTNTDYLFPRGDCAGGGGGCCYTCVMTADDIRRWTTTTQYRFIYKCIGFLNEKDSSAGIPDLKKKICTYFNFI